MKRPLSDYLTINLILTNITTQEQVHADSLLNISDGALLLGDELVKRSILKEETISLEGKQVVVYSAVDKEKCDARCKEYSILLRSIADNINKLEELLYV